MTTKIERRYTGPSFLSLLTLLFIGLKLGGVITWSWWLVLAPILVGFAFWLTVISFILIVGLLVAIAS